MLNLAVGARERCAGAVERRQLHLGERRARPRARAADGAHAGACSRCSSAWSRSRRRRRAACAHGDICHWSRAGVVRHPHGARRGVDRELSAQRARAHHGPHRRRQLAGGGGFGRARGLDARGTHGSIRAGCTAQERVAGLAAAWLYRETRVRRQFRLLAEESGEQAAQASLSACACCARSSAADPSFREYMFWMGLFGGGNLMLTAQLVVIFSRAAAASRARCRSRCCPWCRSRRCRSSCRGGRACSTARTSSFIARGRAGRSSSPRSIICARHVHWMAAAALDRRDHARCRLRGC